MKLVPDFSRKYGKLKLVRMLPRNKHMRVEAVCDCGTVKAFNFSNLNKGTTQSCGCYHSQRCVEALTTHGMSHKSPVWSTWTRMRRRCYSKSGPDWADYGGRGITMCPEWKDDFARFYADMGDRPSDKHSIDRINNDGNYEPGNCRWADKFQQARNKRNNHRVTFGGETLTISEWAEKLGVWARTVRLRVKSHGTPHPKLRPTP